MKSVFFLFSLSQETLIQAGDPLRLRIIGIRVDANDIVSELALYHKGYMNVWN